MSSFFIFVHWKNREVRVLLPFFCVWIRLPLLTYPRTTRGMLAVVVSVMIVGVVSRKVREEVMVEVEE